MEGNEVGIFVRAPDWMPLFLLKIKIKQNLGCLNKEYNVQSSTTFIRISGPIAEVKKFALINDYENIIAYSEESEQSEVYANKCGLFQIHLGGLKISATSGKFDYFYSHLNLETVLPALKLIQIVL